MSSYTINSRGYFKDDSNKNEPRKQGGANIVRVSNENATDRELASGTKPRTKSKTRQSKESCI